MSKLPAVTIEDVRAVAPSLAKITGDAIINGVWKRPGLPPRDRSIVTLSALIAQERTTSLPHYTRMALNMGVTAAEISEIVTHVAFYAGWPAAFSATMAIGEVFAEQGIGQDGLPAVTPELLPAGEGNLLPGEVRTFSPHFAEITDRFLFGDVWRRPGLAQRDRHLATIGAVITTGQTGVLSSCLAEAAKAGITKAEVAEIIPHIAFYVGWPAAIAAASIAKDLFAE